MTSDIKPERSNVVSSKGKKGIGGSSLLFVSFLSLLNLGGLVILGLWFFNNSDYQQETGENFSERIGSLEESVLRKNVAEILVLRASGHAYDSQRQYPNWELRNSELQRLLKIGVGGVIFFGGCANEL